MVVSSEEHHDPLETMTVAEVAEILKCNNETVRRMIARGELRAVTLGRRKRIPRVELEDYILNGGSTNGSHGE